MRENINYFTIHKYSLDGKFSLLKLRKIILFFCKVNLNLKKVNICNLNYNLLQSSDVVINIMQNFIFFKDLNPLLRATFSENMTNLHSTL